MALKDQEKKDLFSKIRIDTIKGIYDDHQKLPYRMWGWVKNKVRGVTGASNVTKVANVTNLGLSAISSALDKIPLVGTVVTTVGGGVVSAVQANELYKRACKSDDPDDKVKLTGEYMVVSGAQAVADAVRKVDDAAAETKKKQVKNCKDFNEMMSAVYYYNYRLQRLMMYNGQLKMYAEGVERKLLAAHKQWEDVEKVLEREGPKMWDDWSWHTQNCSDDCCTFPWNSREISGPTNVKLPPGLQGVKLNPINKQPPPLPPKPFKKP